MTVEKVTESTKNILDSASQKDKKKLASWLELGNLFDISKKNPNELAETASLDQARMDWWKSIAEKSVNQQNPSTAKIEIANNDGSNKKSS